VFVPNDWASRTDQDVELDTWDECVNLLLSSGGGRTMYRGHRRFDWELQSMLERVLLEFAHRFDADRYELMNSMVVDHDTEEWTDGVERRLTDYFRRNAERFRTPDLPESWDKVGWWEVMQHHGAPTRLMDWTGSPFVALWFALEGHRDGEGDMALWIYDLGNAEVNHTEARSKLRAMADFDVLTERQMVNRFVELATGDGNPAPIVVRPRPFPRAVAQQSVLTVTPSISTARPAHWWIRRKLATRVRLREEWKSGMVAACTSMGLTRPGLFRDLDSLGLYVRQHFLEGVELEDGIY
jgi:hypothetical protein